MTQLQPLVNAISPHFQHALTRLLFGIHNLQIKLQLLWLFQQSGKVWQRGTFDSFKITDIPQKRKI